MNRTLFAISIAARLPHGLFSIAVLVHVASVTDSFAVAGACTGVLAVAQAMGGPLAGRMVDRYGQAPVLVTTTGACAAALVAMAVTPGGASAGWLLAWSAVIGAGAPPVGACFRALVPTLVPTQTGQRSAYAADAAATEITWVAGPLLTFTVAGLFFPAAALVLAAVVLTVAVTGFAASTASRAWQPSTAPRQRGGALRSVGLRVLVVVLVGVGVLFGATEVAVTATTEAWGSPGSAGPLLGLWGLGSLCGGVAAARFGGGARTGRGLAAMLVALGLGHASLAAATDDVLLMGLLIAAAGSMIAPILATAYAMVDAIVPAGTTTEAFTWLATATAVGTAMGAALAGNLAETSGATWGFGLAGLAAVTSAALAATRLGAPRAIAALGATPVPVVPVGYDA